MNVLERLRNTRKSGEGADGEPAPLGHPRIFRIDRRAYAVGLFWQTSESQKEAVRNAKATASNPKVSADLYTIRSGPDGAEYALARSREGVPIGAVAAAAAIASRIPESSWAGVFDLEGGWWFVSVREGFLLSEGDVFYQDEIAAKEKLTREISRGGLERIIAPNAWGITDSEQIDLSNALSNARSPALRHRNPFRQHLVKILAFILVASVSLTGTYLYQQHLERQAALKRQRKIRQQLRQEQKEKKTPPRPWTDEPDPSAFIAACISQGGRLPAGAPGFTRTRTVCDGKSLTHRYAADETTNVAWIRDWSEGFPSYSLSVTSGGGSAEMTSAFDAPSARADAAPPGELRPPDDVRLDLLAEAQRLDDAITFKAASRWTPPPGRAKRYKKASHGSMLFTVKTTTPRFWAERLSRIPGSNVERFVTNEKDVSDTYTIRGKIHVRF